MSLTANGFTLSVELIDNGANVTQRSYKLTSADIDAALTDAGTIISALNAVTDAVVKGYHVASDFVEAALTLPGEGVQIENQALVDLSITGHPEKAATYTIPAPNIGIMVGSSGPDANVVDGADSALAAYTALFQADGQATISDGEVALSFLRGKRIHRKSSRG